MQLKRQKFFEIGAAWLEKTEKGCAVLFCQNFNIQILAPPSIDLTVHGQEYKNAEV